MPSITDKIRLNRKQDRRARFTDEEVNEMRELYAKGWTQKVIAEHFGTHQSTVGYIVSEKAHEHLAEMLEEARADVAREIFEEIKICMEYEYMSYLKAYDYTLLTRIEELEKKYTEK